MSGDLYTLVLNSNLTISLINFMDDSIEENQDLCESSPCKKKKTNIVIPIAASVGGVIILLLIAAALLIGLKKKKKQGNFMSL